MSSAGATDNYPAFLRPPWLTALLSTTPWLYCAWHTATDTVGFAYTPGAECRFFGMVYLAAGLLMGLIIFLLLSGRPALGPRIGALVGCGCAWPLVFFGSVFGSMLLMFLGVNGNAQQVTTAKWAYTWSVIASLAAPQLIFSAIGIAIGRAAARRKARELEGAG